jgi:hypothetical protein
MSDTPATEPFVFNGVDGASGNYVTSLSIAELSALAQGKPLSDPQAPPAAKPSDLATDEHLNDLAYLHRKVTEPAFALAEGYEATDLASSGWGVVFAPNANPAVREALAPLLDHRRAQAAATNEKRYREFAGADTVQPGESKNAFLARHGAAPGPVHPDVMPYYLLLVGGPDAIGFEFQVNLDVPHAVGRIHFADASGGDDLDAYAAYARGVVAAETGARLPRRAAFVAIQNPDDPATTLSATDLVPPLAARVQADKTDWTVETITGDAAKKAGLLALLNGEAPPALLFTASHGMGFPAGDARQLPHQGALLCNDWPGPRNHKGAIPQDYYLAGDDIGDAATLGGMIAFHFACYGAGTPHMDDYAHRALATPQPIAPHPFVAALPQRLLGHPKGGALAAVGHIERAWGYSFLWEKTPGQSGRQIEVFASTLKRLMEGHPIGSALEHFNQRYAELATVITQELSDVRNGKTPNDFSLGTTWTAHNDARGYALLGDPAVRLVPSGDEGS